MNDKPPEHPLAWPDDELARRLLKKGLLAPEAIEKASAATAKTGQSLADESLLEIVINDLKRKEIPPEKIYFEITETATINNLENAIHFMTTLREVGCRFALDDFGSGLSSFAYLKTMPVDFLKIDGAFVKNLANDVVDYAMVKAINDVGRAMGKKTIAEFVEDDAILQKLRDIGVDYAQGYGIAHPQPLEKMITRH